MPGTNLIPAPTPNEDQPEEPVVAWWPGRTSAITSAVMMALACPLLVFAAFGFLSALLTHAPVTKPGEQRDEDVGIGIAVAYIAGVITLTLGGLLAMGAAGLFLRPGFRARVMGVIAGLMVVLPVGAQLRYRSK